MRVFSFKWNASSEGRRALCRHGNGDFRGPGVALNLGKVDDDSLRSLNSPLGQSRSRAAKLLTNHEP